MATECRANNASVTTVFSPKSSSCPSDATHADAATFRCGTVRKAVVMAVLKNKFFLTCDCATTAGVDGGAIRPRLV